MNLCVYIYLTIATPLTVLQCTKAFVGTDGVYWSV